MNAAFSDIGKNAGKGLQNNIDKTFAELGKKAVEQSSVIGSAIKNIVSETNTLYTKSGDIKEITKGFGELGEKLKEVALNGEITSQSITIDGGFVKRIKDANVLYTEQSRIIKELNALEIQKAKSDGTTGTKKLDSEIAYLKSQKSEYDALIKQVDTLAFSKSNLAKLANEEANAQKNLEKAMDAVNKKRHEATQGQLNNQLSDTAAVKEAETALRNLENAYKEYNAAKERGDTEGESHWAKRVAESKAEIDNIEKSVEKLDAESDARKKIVDLIQQAKDVQSKDAYAANEAFNVEQLQRAQTAVSNLTTAYNQYNIAKKAGNTEGMDYWSKQISSSQAVIANISEGIGELNLEESTRTRINNLLAQAQNLQAKQTSEINSSGKSLDNVLTRLYQFVAIRFGANALRTMWREATSYVREYYDALNEIRIVSGMSESDADGLGKKYRQLAKDMKVDSKEIASAAVEYWRQGLPEGEVENRLVSTIEYAKISRLEFEEAAQ